MVTRFGVLAGVPLLGGFDAGFGVDAPYMARLRRFSFCLHKVRGLIPAVSDLSYKIIYLFVIVRGL